MEVLPDAAIAAMAAADAIADRAREAVDERGVFTMALSGGTAPLHAFRLLTDAEVPWEQVEIFQVD